MCGKGQPATTQTLKGIQKKPQETHTHLGDTQGQSLLWVPQAN